MPGIPFSMPLSDALHPLVGCPVDGPIDAQRAALAQLCAEAGWPEVHKEDSGRPRVGQAFCSLSHGGGWALAARHPRPIGIDVEAESERLFRVRSRFCGPLDAPVTDCFGDGAEALCRLWTAKEAAFKAFGTAVDFLTGLEWTEVTETGARIHALQHGRQLDLQWTCMPGDRPVWLAVAIADPDITA